MELLSAALAFALTMLALSIVVTSTVETIHRVVGLREKGLRVMMGHLYDTTVAQHVARSPLSLADPRDRFQNVMTLNRAPTGDAKMGTADGALRADPENDRHFLSRIWSGRRIGSLPLDDFMTRLGGSAFGDSIAQIARDVGPDAIRAVARDLAQQFDDASRDASEYFAARARLIAVIVGIVIAWLGYVHPYELMGTYLRNPDVTAKVNAMRDEIMSKLEQSDDALETSTTRQDVGQDLTASRQRTREQIEELASAGVPIGWNAERLNAAGFSRLGHVVVYPDSWKGCRNAAWLILGGLLIGLGGPVWRDTVFSLTRIVPGSSNAEAKIAPSPEATDARVVSAAERFLTASNARVAIAGDPDDDTEPPVG